MLEWFSLRFVDNAPWPVWIATGAFAAAVLAVLQTKDWLDFRGRWYFTCSLIGLIAAWIAVSAYGFWAYPPQDKIIPTFPTADEIGSALARNLRPLQQAAPTAPAPPTTPLFVNPFHDDLVKWRIVEGIRLGILRNGISQDCHVTIVRLQEPYPEDFSAEFKRILDVIGWKWDEQFATKTIEKDITVHAVDYNQTAELRAQPAPSRDCASALGARIQNDTRTRHGASLNAGPYWFPYVDAPNYLKECGRQCLEVDFGNEDAAR